MEMGREEKVRGVGREIERGERDKEEGVSG